MTLHDRRAQLPPGQPSRAALWVVALLLLTTSGVHAQAPTAGDVWGLGSFANRGVDPNAVATFRDLLRDELRSRTGVGFVDIAAPCEDIECVRGAAGGSGATVVVHASVSQLGQKLVISVNAAEVKSGASRFSERMNAAGPEELDVIAARMAEAIARGTGTDQTAELGMITEPEAEQPLRREGRFAGTLTLQGILPTKGFAGEIGGGGVELGLWFETLDIAIEPRIGVRFDLGDRERDYFHVPIELGASYLFSRGDISPMLGIGAGMHFVWEEEEVQTTVGEFLRTTSNTVIEDQLTLFAVYARAGIMVLRTYTGSMVLSIDYAIGFGEFQERNNEQAIRFNIQMVVGS